MTGTPTETARLRADTLSPSSRMVSAVGPMKVMPAAGAGLGEFRALRQQAVAGMDGVGARFLRHPDDLGDRQIGGDRPQHLAVGELADLIGLVRLEAMEGELVLLGEHRDRAAAELIGGAQHADGDFRAVGDEDFLDRHARAPF